MPTKKIKKSPVEKLINTGFLLSIGIASITKEKLEKTVTTLVKRGKIDEKQGRKMIKDLLTRGKKERARIKKILKR